jgi:hypothetical protein
MAPSQSSVPDCARKHMSIRPRSRALGTILRLVSAKTRGARLLHLGAVFGIAFVFLLATMNRTVNAYDEGVILFGSVRVMSGDVPYRDFYANYGPGQFYALAALFKAFGPSVLVGRIWDLLIRALSVLVVYLMFVRAGARRMAPVAALLSLLWLAALLHGYNYPIFPCLLFTFLSIYCAMPAYCGRRGPLSLVQSGALIGIVALFRPDSGVMAAMAHVATLGLLCLKEGTGAHARRATFVRSTAALVAGMLLVSVPAWSLLLFAVPFQEVLRDLALIPAKTYWRMRSLPFPSLLGLLDDLVHLRLGLITARAVYLPLVAVFVGSVVTLGRRASGAPKPGAVLEATSLEATSLYRCRRGVILVLTCLSFVFFFKGFVRGSVLHMAPALVPALLIACMSWLGASGSRLVRVLALLLTTCVVIVSAGPFRQTVRLLIGNIAWYAEIRRNEIAGQATPPDAPCHASDGLERLGCFRILSRSEQDQIKAIRYVQARTVEDERIFVGTTRHDKIFVNNVLFYFVSKRLSATQWHHFDPGVQTTAAIQAEMIAELEAHKPRVVVLDSQWDAINEPNESRLSSGVTLLDDYIRTRYRRGASFGSMHVRLLQPRGE